MKEFFSQQERRNELSTDCSFPFIYNTVEECGQYNYVISVVMRDWGKSLTNYLVLLCLGGLTLFLFLASGGLRPGMEDSLSSLVCAVVPSRLERERESMTH